MPTAGSEGTELDAARMADLPVLIALLARASARVGADEEAMSDLRLATEEVFANILRHGYRGVPGPVRVRVDATPERISVTLADAAPDFDPARLPGADVGAALAMRQPGGLGWHLVHQVMDEVRREAAPGGGNVFTLVRRLVPAPPGQQDG